MLVMAVQASGLRSLQPLPNVAEWCRCFDVMQVNEDEVTAMAPDPMALAATALALMRAPLGYALLAMLPAIVWSRLVLGRHTPLEAAIGAIIGAATGAAIHYL